MLATVDFSPDRPGTLEEALVRSREFAPAARLGLLVRERLADLPLPGGGDTLGRWRTLARVGAEDLSLAKLFEGHTDALAIRRELGAAKPGATTRWGTWCAEGPGSRVEIASSPRGLVIHGTKAWCSGAAEISHGLLTAWRGDLGPFLVAVDLRQPGVSVTDVGWNAVGMRASASVDVTFDGALVEQVGQAGDYLTRPGFWQGGIGVAACWFGGATAIAEQLAARMAHKPEPHALAHLGAVDVALASARALLVEAANFVDAEPTADARGLALRTRAAIEEAVEVVLRHVGRALGAAPFCKDSRFAQLAADLPVFVRQSHAERDLAALGEVVAASASRWSW